MQATALFLSVEARGVAVLVEIIVEGDGIKEKLDFKLFINL